MASEQNITLSVDQTLMDEMVLLIAKVESMRILLKEYKGAIGTATDAFITQCEEILACDKVPE